MRGLRGGSVEERLQRRWDGEEARVSAIVGDMKANQDWTRRLLADPEGAWPRIDMLDRCPVGALPNEAAARDLRGIRLDGVDLCGVTRLGNTCLDYATFSEVLCVGVSFVGSSLIRFRADSECVFRKASFQFARLEDAVLRGLSLADTTFSNGSVEGADLREADIANSVFQDIRFCDEGVLGFLGIGRRATKLGGGKQTADDPAKGSDREFVHFLAGQCERYDYRRRHRGLAGVSYLLTNFGSSPGRLFLWVLTVWLGFGFVFACLPLPGILHGTWIGESLIWLGSSLEDPGSGVRIRDPVRALYFSAVTLTTLGLGDLVPSPTHWQTMLYIGLEAVLGYVLLGAFVSILLKNMRT